MNSYHILFKSNTTYVTPNPIFFSKFQSYALFLHSISSFTNISKLPDSPTSTQPHVPVQSQYKIRRHARTRKYLINKPSLKTIFFSLARHREVIISSARRLGCRNTTRTHTYNPSHALDYTPRLIIKFPSVTAR